MPSLSAIFFPNFMLYYANQIGEHMITWDNFKEFFCKKPVVKINERGFPYFTFNIYTDFFWRKHIAELHSKVWAEGKAIHDAREEEKIRAIVRDEISKGKA